MNSVPPPPIPLRRFSLGMFLTGLLWLVVASVASDRLTAAITFWSGDATCGPVVHAVLYAALMLVGFAGLHWMAVREWDVARTNELPRRATGGQEWKVGAALGWGWALAVLLVLVVLRCTETNFWVTPRSIGLTLLFLVAALFLSLGLEVAFRGYLYRRMIDATGVVAATTILALFYALVLNFAVPSASLLSFVTEFVLAIVFSIAYLRTQALWLGWGLHFAWIATLGVLFGLPMAGDGALSAAIITDLHGPALLSGAGFGPEGSVVTLLLALLALPLLYSLTRDFAWEYTAPVIVAGGYPMDAQPPAAHTAMEANARPAAAPPLVQILAATPTEPSSRTDVTEHLREEREP